MEFIKTCIRCHRFFKPRVNIFRKYSSEISEDKEPWPRQIVSGIQPTGELHIGNYFGVIRRLVALQDAGDDVTVFIADLHALTAARSGAAVDLTPNKHALEMAALVLASGLDPACTTLFVQSSVPRCAELCWVLACLASQVRLQRLPQYREKAVRQNQETLGCGLLLYPVLQAADVLVLRGTHVPVGADQLQHLQVARELRRAFVSRFPGPPPFPAPLPLVADDGSDRVLSLRDPRHKMSKSAADGRSRVLLTDCDDTVRTKIRKAVTDCTPQVTFDPENRPGVSNLVRLYSLATGCTPEEAVAEADTLDTLHFKRLVADRLCDELRPVRQRYEELVQRPGVVRAVLRDGAARARRRADETYAAVCERAGLTGGSLSPDAVQRLPVRATTTH